MKIKTARFPFLCLLITGLWAVCGWRAAAQAAPYSLYAILNNHTQLVTINVTNCQVTRTINLTGVPATAIFENPAWSSRDAMFYTLLWNPTGASTYDVYLAHFDPVTGVAQTNKLIGAAPSNFYESLAYDDVRQVLVASRGPLSANNSSGIGILSTNGSYTEFSNNSNDNDFFAYDSRRGLLYTLDSGNAPGVNRFALTSLTGGGYQVLRSFSSNAVALAYHRGLDAFFVVYAGGPQLYRWTINGDQTVTETLMGTISGLAPSLNVEALMPVPYEPVVALKTSESTTQTVCIAREFPLAANVTQGTAPVKSVTYYDAGVAIGFSTNSGRGFVTNAPLALGIHQLTAQAFDGYLTATSPPQVVYFAPPASNHLAIQLMSGGTGCVCCLGGIVPGQSYVVESTTNLPAGWTPYATNVAGSDPLVVTNAPLGHQLFFRSQVH